MPEAHHGPSRGRNMQQFLDLVEVAGRIGLDAAETRRLLERQGIAGRTVQGIEVFERSEILRWLERTMKDLSDERLSGIDRASAGYADWESSGSVVTRLLDSGCVCPCLSANTRPSALRKLSELAVSTGMIYDGPMLYSLLCEREELCSTALGNGVAIPHPRSPHPLYVQDDVLVLARTAHPIPFGEERGNLTWLFMLVISGDPSRHLHLLARISMILRGDGVIEALREAPSGIEMLETIAGAETRIVEDLTQRNRGRS